jgi:hypothetical protein
MGKCPAHSDRRDSLSIGVGRDLRVIVNDFAGCSVTSILKAMNLRLRDLFSSEPPSPEQRAAIEEQRDWERRRGRQLGEAAADARRFEQYVERLGAELARLSDDEPRGPEMTRHFHEACGAMHGAQQKWEQMRTARAVNAGR